MVESRRGRCSSRTNPETSKQQRSVAVVATPDRSAAIVLIASNRDERAASAGGLSAIVRYNNLAPAPAPLVQVAPGSV